MQVANKIYNLHLNCINDFSHHQFHYGQIFMALILLYIGGSTWVSTFVGMELICLFIGFWLFEFQINLTSCGYGNL